MLLDSQYLTFYMVSNEIQAYDSGESMNISEVLSDKELYNDKR